MTNDYGNLELHQVLLAAMKDIDRICREHGLKYYLYAGSLLGAINHKGFIPWDDDVDISMPAKDYRVFAEIVEKEYAESYRLKTYNNTKEHYSKLNKLQVLGAEVIYENGDREPVFVDISVFHNAPDGKLLQWVQKTELEFWDRVLSVKAGRIVPTSLVSKLVLVPCAHISKAWIGCRLDKVMGRHDEKETTWYALMIHMLPNPYTGVDGYHNDFVERRICDNPQNIEFEDSLFLVYSEPEIDLLRRYGKDYAKPYPEEKRKSKHGICEYSISEELRRRIMPADKR